MLLEAVKVAFVTNEIRRHFLELEFGATSWMVMERDLIFKDRLYAFFCRTT